MRAPRAVVFDMDGLMFNTEDVYWEVGCRVLDKRGCRFTRELSDAMIGLPPQPSFEVMIRWHALGDGWRQLAAESEELFAELLDDYLAPMPGLSTLLEVLEAAGVPKAICTSSTRRALTAVLSRFDFEPRFAFTLTADDIRQGKPHPEIYLLAAQRLGVRPHELVVLEDSEAGCRSAAMAGTFAVAVPSPHTARHDFGVASLVVESLADPRLYDALQLKLPVT